MKKHVILATAVALSLAGITMADQPKTAEATKPAPTTQTTTSTTSTAPAAQATATKPAAATTTSTTTNTTMAPATTTTTTTTTTAKQEVTFKCTGIDATNVNTVKAGFTKADGVFNANVDPMTGKVTCQIDQAKTNLDKLLTVAKNNKWNCTK